jgi:NDP-sugar pyrophosphorylase family protein
MKKVRISMTISESVLRRLDSSLAAFNARSRSEAIESIIKRFVESNRVAVFLGGGDLKKIRLSGTFKPLLKIRGRHLIEHNIESLKKAGFKRIFFIGKNQLIGEIFKVLGNGSSRGVEVVYIEEKRTLGNAKTLQLAEPYIKSPFLVLPIDNFFDFDLSHMVARHSGNRGLVTLAIQATRESLSDLGVVEMAGDQIVGYEEKPRNPKTFLTSAFIGMYNPKIFDYIPRGDVKWVLQTDLFPQLLKENLLFGYMITGYSVNIHSEEDISKLINYRP